MPAAAHSGAEEQWLAIERYICATLLDDDPALDASLRRSDEAGLPPIAVSPNQGKMLHILARMLAARSILELGTLGAYSTIWLARALPSGGHLVTVEANAAHARVAAANLAAAGVEELVDLRVGDALEELARLRREAAGPFDMIFIDADKQRIPEYFRESLGLTRPGSLIVVDNVVRGGAILDERADDPRVDGVRRFMELAGSEPAVTVTVIPTVGSKGLDGFALALVGDQEERR